MTTKIVYDKLRRLRSIGYKAPCSNEEEMDMVLDAYDNGVNGITSCCDKHVIIGTDVSKVMDMAMEIIRNRCGSFIEYEGLVTAGFTTMWNDSDENKNAKLRLEAFCNRLGLQYFDYSNEGYFPAQYIRIINQVRLNGRSFDSFAENALTILVQDKHNNRRSYTRDDATPVKIHVAGKILKPMVFIDTPVVMSATDKYKRLQEIGYKRNRIDEALADRILKAYDAGEHGVTTKCDQHAIYASTATKAINKAMQIIESRCGLFNKYDGVVTMGFRTWNHDSDAVRNDVIEAKRNLETFCNTHALGYIDFGNQYVNFVDTVPRNYIRILYRDYVAIEFDAFNDGNLTILVHTMFRHCKRVGKLPVEEHDCDEINTLNEVVPTV